MLLCIFFLFFQVLFVLFHFFLSLIYSLPEIKLIVFIENAVKFGPYGTKIMFVSRICFTSRILVDNHLHTL